MKRSAYFFLAVAVGAWLLALPALGQASEAVAQAETAEREGSVVSSLMDDSLCDSDVIPAGTHMVIPREIMEEYKPKEREWGHPFNYLSHYYSALGPSMIHKGRHTYYVPLSRKMDEEDANQCSEMIWISLQEIRVIVDGRLFRTVKDMHVVELGKEEGKFCMAVGDVRHVDCVFSIPFPENKECWPQPRE